MKRALLTVSFGTSYPDTRRQTIESIEQDLQKAFPDRLFARAWSSSFLRRKVKDREGVSVDSPADALRKQKEQGVKDVLVANTHLMNGEENDSLRKALLQEKDGFARLAVARPLMAEDADIEKLAKVLMKAFSFAGTNELVALMGHGSEFPMDNPYLKLQKYADNPFTISEECISCGLCSRVCPCKNIELVDGTPTFLHHCANCMACVVSCPKRAIGYEITKGDRKLLEASNSKTFLVKVMGLPRKRKLYMNPYITAKDLIKDNE